MFVVFIILSIVLSFSIFLIKNRTITKIFFGIFLVLLTGINSYAFLHINQANSIYFKFDSIGIILSLILNILSIATIYHSYLYLKRHQYSKKQEARYYASLMMLITAMISAYFSENIAVLWVSIETTTLFVSILIFFERTKEALEAAWKYLFISSVGVALAFIGILFLSITASSNGLTDLSISHLIETANSMNPIWLKMAFLLVLTGFSVKMELFPLYTVSIGAHTVILPPINVFLSTALMNVGFLGIFRIFTIISQTEILHWAQNVLLIVGVLSIFMSAIQLLKIKHYKRMLAYSSLEHAGIVALGLGIGGIGYYAAILHLVLHSLVKAGLFSQMGQVHRYFNSYWIKDVAGYFKLNPIGGLMMIVGFISILAMPPSGMFVSEFLVFKAMFLAKHYYIGIFVLLLLTLIIYSFSKNIFHLLYGEPQEKLTIEKLKPNNYETISQFVLFGLAIYLGINPPVFFTDLINSAITILN